MYVILPKISQVLLLLLYPSLRSLFLFFFVASPGVLDVVVVVVVVTVVVVIVVVDVVPISSPTAATISLSIGSVSASPCKKGRSTYKASLGI